MSSELLSTARPSRLRVWGFLATVIGAALVGFGATREWASVGLIQDRAHANDVPTNGVDIWEGKACLLLAAIALALMLAARLARSPATRRALMGAIVATGIVCAVLAASAALRADARFGGENGIDRFAHAIAQQTHQAEDVVRAALRQSLREDVLRVDLGTGVWVTVGGGIVLALGGALGFAWVRERERLGEPATGAHAEPV